MGFFGSGTGLAQRKDERQGTMYKGIYIAASGAILKQAELDVATQNLANANTTAYKKDIISFKEYLFQTEAGTAPDGRAMSDYSDFKTDFTNGTIVQTGNTLDIAIDGNGLIALEGDLYTRRGDLKKNREGYLTTFDGKKVMGNGGPIMIPEDSVKIDIDSEGKVSVIQSGSTTPVEIDTMKIMDFGPDAVITKAGNGQLMVSGNGTPATSVVMQGYLEKSNVDTVKEMVRMIGIMREFESYQKIIQSFDDSTAKVNNEMGRL
jgi:flagellar basal-body rod protein FlgG